VGAAINLALALVQNSRAADAMILLKTIDPGKLSPLQASTFYQVLY